MDTYKLAVCEDDEMIQKELCGLCGGILDEEAAAQGLKSGKLGGVGVDVIKGELADLSGGDVLYSPLFDCGGNYVVSPHIGARTYEAQEAIGTLVCEQIMSYFHLDTK